MADPTSWDDTDQQPDRPQTSRPQRRSLRVSHLERSPERPNAKLQDMTSSLKASSEVLSTADRMLDHYRCINDEQDDEIRRLRSELDHSTELLRDRKHQRTRSQVRFADQNLAKENQGVDDLHMSLRSLESEQRKLASEINRDREERTRIEDDHFRTIRRLEDSFRRVEDDYLRATNRRESEDRQGNSGKKDFDVKEALSDSMRLTLEKEREIRELKDQLRESQRRRTEEEDLESKVRQIYEQERSASKEKKEVGKLIAELKNVKEMMNDSVNEKRMKEQMKRLQSDEEREQRRSEREGKLLKKIETLEDRLEDSEREKRKAEKDIGSVVKRLEWTENGRLDLLKQIEELNKEMKSTSDESTFLSSKLRNCQAKLEESELLRDRLSTRLDALCKKYEKEDEEKAGLSKKIERLTDKLNDKSRELAENVERARKQERIAEESENKKEELKNRALETIKEYKIKCRSSEKDAERYKNELGELKEELRKFKRHVDEGSTRHLSIEKELREITNERDKLRDELDRTSRQVDGESRELTKRLNAALDENMLLEKRLSSLKEENKRLTERILSTEKMSDEETRRLNQELIELKEGIRDVFGKKSRLEVKLKEEQSSREELLNAVTEAKEEQARAKDEVASLYRQLQEEREDYNASIKDLKEKNKKLRDQSSEENKECEKQLRTKQEEFEEKFNDIKLQLADEKSTVKALRKQQEKDSIELEDTRSALNRATEEKNSLRQKLGDITHETNAKDEMRERDKTRISELEAEVKRCHRCLNRVTDEQKDELEKVNEAVDELIERFCQEHDITRPSPTNQSLNDGQNWANETTAKFKWLEDQLNGRLRSQKNLKDQMYTYRDKMKDVLGKADKDKDYLMAELEKQNKLLNETMQRKKELETKEEQNQNTIKALKKKNEKLSKYLDTSTKALEKSINTLEDKQKILDEFDNLWGDQQERDRIRSKYARYQERVSSLKRELTDAKSQAEDLKQDTKDASSLSERLLESLNRLSSPGLFDQQDKDVSTRSFSTSRTKKKEEFVPLDYFSSSSEDSHHVKEDHNFKTPDKVSLRDLKHKDRLSTRKTTRIPLPLKPERE